MPWGPSDAEGVRAATEDDIHRIVEEFADAAVRAQAAGFDGVEVHAGHGYLFTAFLSAIVNRRNDAWGGPLEHRARLLRDTVRAIRARVEPGVHRGRPPVSRGLGQGAGSRPG